MTKEEGIEILEKQDYKVEPSGAGFWIIENNERTTYSPDILDLSDLTFVIGLIKKISFKAGKKIGSNEFKQKLRELID